MGCARTAPAVSEPPSVSLDVPVRGGPCPPPRLAPALPGKPPQALHVPGTVDGDSWQTGEAASQLRLQASQEGAAPGPPGLQPPPVPGTPAAPGPPHSEESLYALACRELRERGLAEPTAPLTSAVDLLDSSLSCARGPFGVTSLSFAEDPLLTRTYSFTRAHSSPLAMQGEQMVWVRGELLGRGSLGTVFCALDQKKGQVIAVKEVPIDRASIPDMKLKATLEHEVDIIQYLKHPHIVSYLGHDYIDSCLYIYLEYMPGGSLTQVLAQFGILDESLIAVYARELLEGLDYLHAQRPPVLHRDIKSGNVLVGLDCHVKLADFGCSKRQAETLSHTMKGSVPWMAPEVIRHSGYGRAADVWSLGCVIVEMATALPPWGKFDNIVAACYRIGMTEQTLPVPDTLSKSCQDFVECCVRREPLVRLSAAELLLHSFVEHLEAGAPQRRGTLEYMDTVPDPELLDLLPECVD